MKLRSTAKENMKRDELEKQRGKQMIQEKREHYISMQAHKTLYQKTTHRMAYYVYFSPSRSCIN